MERRESDSWRVSVVVPMRNEEAHIGQCLAALVGQDYPSDLIEIFVVDGQSSDRSREIVRDMADEHPWIKLLDNPSRKTPAGFNVGIRAAQGDVVAIVSAHCELDPDYIRQCIRYLKETGAENVGGLMHPVSDTFWGDVIGAASSSPFGIGNSPFHYSNKEQFVDTVYMGAYRREVFDCTGLFDESLIRNQDYELNYRLRAAGGRIFCTPAIKSRYHGRSDLRALWRQYFDYGFWKARVIRLHPASTKWRHLVAPAFLLALAGGIAMSLAYPPAWPIPASIAGLYALAALVASMLVARSKGWRLFWALPITYAVVHLSWGLGFWWSWVRFVLAGFRDAPA